jgi:pimeloyl-ACP methyl ester carboxylesterase
VRSVAGLIRRKAGMLPRFKRNFVKSFDGTIISYESCGEGLPLVFCNGVGCNNYVWRYLADHFRHTCRLIFWDYRGHGYSDEPPTPEDVGMEAIIRDLHAVIEDEQLDKAVFFGHSMGSQVILEYYRAHPERVAGLVPVCGNYMKILNGLSGWQLIGENFDGFLNLLRRCSFITIPFWRKVLPTYFSYTIATMVAINGNLLDPIDFRPYFHHIAQVNPFIFFNMIKMLNEHSARDILPDIKVPTFIVAGEIDNMTPLERSREAAETILDCELLVVPHGTHAAPLEQPDLVCLRLERWLRKKFGLTVKPNLAISA